MSNRDSNGVRYGVIAANSLDQDLLHELMYGADAKDLTYEAAYAEAKREAEAKADLIEEEVQIMAAEIDPNMSEFDREVFIEAYTEAAYERNGYQDRDDLIECELQRFSDCYQCDESQYEGEYEGVKYGLSCLGGAYLLWVFEGPKGWAYRLCSPCCPGAADLDGGFTLMTENEFPDEGDYLAYCVPRSWLIEEDHTVV